VRAGAQDFRPAEIMPSPASPAADCSATAGSAQKLDELVAGEFSIAEDLAHEPGSDGFARMHGHHGGSPIWMMEEVVASFDPDHLKGGLPQGPDDVGTCRAG
jgi:hypothetical protein